MCWCHAEAVPMAIALSVEVSMASRVMRTRAMILRWPTG